MTTAAATKMNAAKRTPGPWEVTANSIGDRVKIFAPYSTGHVGNCDAQGGTLATREANAAFIIQACNAYDAHVARIAELELLLRRSQTLLDALAPDNGHCGKMSDDIDAALKVSP